MLTRNIDFKNFKIKKNSQKVKKELKKLLKENNEVIKSLRKTYKNSYSRKLVNKYNKGSNYTVIGMGGSTLGTQTIYDFLGKKLKKIFYLLIIFNQSQKQIIKKKLQTQLFLNLEIQQKR